MMFEELSPPYSTIVADPPWHYEQGGPTSSDFTPVADARSALRPPPYSTMTVKQISELGVGDLAGEDAHLYLWTTNRYLPAAFDVAASWGFHYSTTLVWAKTPRGIGPGGAFTITTEFVLFCRRGHQKPATRIDSTWWHWTRGPHSQKPDAFMDLVEQVSPGPYLELFSRRPRFGWDTWGKGYEGAE